ncbi:DUF47 domain-containing protein [Chloroflexota bacterium]
MFGLPFIPREQKFFDLFESSSHNVVKTAEKLRELVDSWDNIGARVAEITDLEHEGDSITHQIMEQLNRSFVTPIDREDIVLLAHSLDDVTDFIHAAADAMLIYKVNPPDQRAKELADLVVQAALEVENAIRHLRRRGESKQIFQRCVEINRLENMADRIYRLTIGELFENSNDITHIIKWREIYEHMETATDRCEDISDVLEGVALKYA